MAIAVGTWIIGLYATTDRRRPGPYFSQELTVDQNPEAVRRFLGNSVDDISYGRSVRNPEALDLSTAVDIAEKIDSALPQSMT